MAKREAGYNAREMTDLTLQMIERVLKDDKTVPRPVAREIVAFCLDPAPRTPEVPASEPERMVSVKQSAEILSVSPRTIQRWISSKELPSRRIMGCRRISTHDLAAFAGKNDGGRDYTPAGDCEQDQPA